MTDAVKPPDPDRRRFFRQFAGDMASSVGSVLGAAQLLQRESADAARELLGGESAAAPRRVGDAGRAGRGDRRLARPVPLGRRRVPDRRPAAAARTCWSTSRSAARARRSRRSTRASLVGRAGPGPGRRGDARDRRRADHRVAAVRAAGDDPRRRQRHAPRAARLRAAWPRPWTGCSRCWRTWASRRTGEDVAAAMAAEATRIIGEAVDDHGALVGHLLGGVLPAPADAPLRVLVAGSTGAMGGGQFGTALSAVQTAHHAGRAVHALVPEGRPGLEGARIASWELRQAGVPHEVVTDAAAPGCIATGRPRRGPRRRRPDRGQRRRGQPRRAPTRSRSRRGPPGCRSSCAPRPARSTRPSPTAPRPRSRRAGRGRSPAWARRASSPRGRPSCNRLQDLVPAALVTSDRDEEGVLRLPRSEASVA